MPLLLLVSLFIRLPMPRRPLASLGAEDDWPALFAVPGLDPLPERAVDALERRDDARSSHARAAALPPTTPGRREALLLNAYPSEYGVGSIGPE